MRLSKPQLPPHVASLLSNSKEALRLLDVHETLTGRRPGRRTDVEVLNKSAIVLLVACWEAYVEDLASASFDALLQDASTPSIFPRAVLVGASKPLQDDKDESKVWALAGTGWQSILKAHRDSVLTRYVGTLNTPKPEQVDLLFEKLVGLKALSTHWHWPKNSSVAARARLQALVTLRGEIAHRVATARSVRKDDVKKASALIGRLATISSNQLRIFVRARTQIVPWEEVQYARD